MTMNSMIRVGIADDHAIVRMGLRRYLSKEVDLRVAGEAENGREALELARSGEVDVLLLDLAMPDQGGLDVLASIKARVPELSVLILSGYPESQYAATLLRRGASGYLNKAGHLQEIVRAIRTVAQGRRYVSEAVAELLADDMAQTTSLAPHERLSDRELQVFLRLAQGETVGRMAPAMFLSVKTVSTYRTRVLEKLHLQSNSDLTYYAMKTGLIQ